MDLRRLELLAELSRLGSMRAVAEEHLLTTSTVSQQLATLAREAGTPLLEPRSRNVRLTPAGRRLAEHAVGILAAVETARHDLDPDADPAGTVRVGGFATTIRSQLLPVMAELAETHPGLRVVVSEYEPREAYDLLADDDLDLALGYDYNLAPRSLPADFESTSLWSANWGLGVPAARAGRRRTADLSRWGAEPWIVNSRNQADELTVRALGNLAGFEPRIAHHIDSLELVEELIVAGEGVGLLPEGRRTSSSVRVLRIREPEVVLTAYAVTRRGRASWSPLRLVRERVVAHSHGRAD